MYKDLVEALPSCKQERGEPWFSDERYDVKGFSAGKKHAIESSGKSGKLAFIDGGNSTVVEAPDYCVSLVRGYYVVFENNKRVTHKQHDYLVTAKTRIEDGKQLYEVSAKPINATKLEMPSFSLNSQDA
ncbi:MAG: hypothetical protein V1834_00250, partial [Candidatus Micrarchaeota archaeon]